MAGFSRFGGRSPTRGETLVLGGAGAASAGASISDEPAVEVAQPPSERLSNSSAPAASAVICLLTYAIPMPDRSIAGVTDAAKASAALLAAVSGGEITPNEAAEIGRLLETSVSTLEITELE